MCLLVEVRSWFSASQRGNVIFSLLSSNFFLEGGGDEVGTSRYASVDREGGCR